MEEEVKVAVLETRLENFETLVSRLDSAIEKIAEVNIMCLGCWPSMNKELRGKKKSTRYCLIRSTNSVIKWTAIMTTLLNDYRYWNGNFGLASEYWEQL